MLESIKEFHVPVTVVLDHVQIMQNQSTHTEDKQKADLVVRNIARLEIKGASLIESDPSNKLAASFIKVRDGDVSGSPQFNVRKAEGKIFESGSSLKY